MYLNFKNKKNKIKKYFLLKKRKINYKTSEEELEYLIKDSVKLRTRSDVPYGLYFSGGVTHPLYLLFIILNINFILMPGWNGKKSFLKI